MGVLRARAGGRPLLFSGAAQRVLAYLALHEAAGRAQVAGALWPDQPQPRADSDLRTALWRLQRISREFAEVSGGVLALRESVAVDVREITAWAIAEISPAAMLATDRCQPPPGAGLELLPGWDEPWLEAPRTRLRMLQTQAYECVAARLLAAGRVPEALPFALQVLQSDPLRESAQHLMMEIHLRQGNVGEALRQYRQYRALLRAELGIAPGLRVTALIGQYAGHVDARAADLS
jgi:DNA-binding SARP family transcriptional activator